MSSSGSLVVDSELQSQRLPHVPCITNFLAMYPFPAFVLSSSAHTVNGGPSIVPTFANQAMHSLLLGQDSGTVDLSAFFLPALGTVDQARRFTEWAFVSGRAADAPVRQTFALALKLGWLPEEDQERVLLEVVQSRVGDALVCTTTPRSALPRFTIQSRAVPASSTRLSKVNLRLTDLPRAFSPVALVSPDPAFISGSSSLMGHSDHALKSSPEPMNCVQRCATYDWASTSLGPRNEWSDTLSASVSYALANPFPVCCWWGPDLVLIYNDAYAEVAGKRHPGIFGKAGSLAWAELWELLGPTSKRVLEGETMHKTEDQLFLNRLTDADLPEESYHNWNYVPVRNRAGKVEGIVNVNIDVTQKVITNRRMDVLRDISTHAGLARTQIEFATSIMNVLQTTGVEAPFAAIYFSTVVEARGGDNEGQTSHVDEPLDSVPLRIKLSLHGSVGIPENHPSMPEDLTVSLIRNKQSTPGVLVSPPPPMLSDAAVQEQADHDALTSSGTGQNQQQHSRASSMTSVPSTFGKEDLMTKSGRGYQAAGSFWPFAEAFASRTAIHVASLPPYVVNGFERRCWNEHAREAVIIPLTSDDSDIPDCMLALGLNSRLAYDPLYESWIDLLRMSLNALLTAVQGREADVTRAAQLAQLDEAKTTFFSNASHEFRTPLTLIQGPLLDSIPLIRDSKIRQKLEVASRNVLRLRRLVDSLLDFSKLAAHRLEGRFRPVALAPYTADLASLFRSVIEKARVEYNVECSKDDYTICYIDPDFWEKIVVNLIGNAFKYTLKGSITVATEASNDQMSLKVTDTGVGIPAADIEKIFERFHRVYSVSRSYEGTGIGLSLTKELVGLHGGRISVTSLTEEEDPDNHGSTFIVSIPLGKEHLPLTHTDSSPIGDIAPRAYGAGVIEEAGYWSVPKTSDPRTPSDASGEWDDASGTSGGSASFDASTLFFTQSDRILLVDDNADMRWYIKSLFAPFCSVVEASSGEEALKIIDAVKPNLVISDVMMPGLGGFGLIAELRGRLDTRLLPIVLLTAKESEEARVEGLLSGADDYMIKPFTAKELIARVHLQMQLGKRRAELEELFSARTREIQVLSDSSPVGIMRADGDGCVTYVNSRWRELTGLGDIESDDQWLECVTTDDLESVKGMWTSAKEGKSSLSLECKFTKGCYVQAQFHSLVSDSGNYNGIIGTITDLSDQKKLEQTRLAHAQERESIARREAEEAEQRRKDADERRRRQELLIDVTSHELRQPVSAILNCSLVVRSNMASLYQTLKTSFARSVPFVPSLNVLREIEEDLDGLDAIYQCGLAQERIANDVLSLSRIQLGALSINPVDFDLVGETRSVVARFSSEVKLKNISVKIEAGRSLENLCVRTVRSDKARFGQILTNLLSNGIKFTDMSSAKREITVTLNVSQHAPTEGDPCLPPGISEPCSPLPQDSRTEPAPIYIFVFVRDSGPGLHPEDLALLFRRFHQGSNSHYVFGGSGLGLFVSRKLCDLMDGGIDVDSVYGEGATFRFFIKALAVPSSPAALPMPTPSSPVNAGARARALHVLIVEDNLINQRILSRQLRREGFITELANNGLHAIEQILSRANPSTQQEHFDVILMDCEMPVMDGLAATRKIRRMEVTGELPIRHMIIALTGNAREGQVESAREAGMDDVIIKPYKLDFLTKRIIDAADAST